MTEEELRAYKNCLLCGNEMKNLHHNNHWTPVIPSWRIGDKGDEEEVEVKACTVCGSVRVFKKEQQ